MINVFLMSPKTVTHISHQMSCRLASFNIVLWLSLEQIRKLMKIPMK